MKRFLIVVGVLLTASLLLAIASTSSHKEYSPEEVRKLINPDAAPMDTPKPQGDNMLWIFLL